MSDDPILVTVDFQVGEECIPAGTVGIPVKLNYLFPTLRDQAPWDGKPALVPLYDADFFKGQEGIEILEWTDKRVAEARRSMHPWRSAKQDNINTIEEAVELVVLRLGDMHEAIMGQTPTRSDEPDWKTLVRWSPILADYETHVRRSLRAMEQLDEVKESTSQRVIEMQAQSFKDRAAAGSAKRVLNNARESLSKALQLLSMDPGSILHLRGLNASVSDWRDLPHGDFPLLGWSDIPADIRWREEMGMVRVWPSVEESP